VHAGPDVANLNVRLAAIRHLADLQVVLVMAEPLTPGLVVDPRLRK
jgi:hypothetical protein